MLLGNLVKLSDKTSDKSSDVDLKVEFIIRSGLNFHSKRWSKSAIIEPVPFGL